MVDNSILPDLSDVPTSGRVAAVPIGLEPVESGPTFVVADPDGLCAADEGRAMSQAWIAVASAEHVRNGRQHAFMQVCHGKSTPLWRIAPADRVIYYSATETFGGKDRLQAFTAIGTVLKEDPYQVVMHPGFTPWRRGVEWWAADEAPIRPLLDRLSFTRSRANWGYQLRFGLFGIDDEDATIIAAAMGC